MSNRASAADRGYGTKWQRARAAYLKANPWCVYCREAGRRTPATVVDHIEPHRRDWKLFWRRSNWQGLCKTCHNGPKQSEEKTGQVRGCDENGLPLDPSHRWNR